MTRGFVDLHCHFVPGIDDGARSIEEAVGILAGLASLGFELVIGTPHMRPGLFDNTRSDLEHAYARLEPELEGRALPRTALSSEHYFDDVVYARLTAGTALPYPGGRAALLEFYEIDFPPMIDRCFADLRRRGILPVIAHPERYRCLWKSLDALERLVESGAAALLDTAALEGKYGRTPRRTAEAILERGLYQAACSDAHRPGDVADVARGIERIRHLYGDEEVELLFVEGPRALLEGHLPE
ncbi:MAG TPA: CpsB/CapC family capsule biosynthesis tyrosine phosphatase [Polyangiaceae bacterium]|nr:CpsB/CapC family capsule biosynthesis tyrosine phosphatase [Polyangiaceae bacterium]